MIVISSSTTVLWHLAIEDYCEIKKKSAWTSCFGGDNKTRTYDLYDVNVAL